MTLLEIVSKTKALRPTASDEQIARWVLMLLVSNQDLVDSSLSRSLTCIEQSGRMMDDQLAAVADELESLATSQPSEFNPSHIWTLLKTIRVQKQVLDLYENSECASVSERSGVGDFELKA